MQLSVGGLELRQQAVLVEVVMELTHNGFSMTLDRNDELEIGRKLAVSEGSRPGFFRRGVTMACF